MIINFERVKGTFTLSNNIRTIEHGNRSDGELSQERERGEVVWNKTGRVLN